MTLDELHAEVLKAKATLVVAAAAGDHDAELRLRDLWPEEFGPLAVQQVNAPTPEPVAHWSEKGDGE